METIDKNLTSEHYKDEFQKAHDNESAVAKLFN